MLKLPFKKNLGPETANTGKKKTRKMKRIKLRSKVGSGSGWIRLLSRAKSGMCRGLRVFAGVADLGWVGECYRLRSGVWALSATAHSCTLAPEA